MIDHVNAGRAGGKADPTLRELGLEGTAECIECSGHYDPEVRLRHMDESGVAAEVVFAGGQNFEELPFMGKGWNAGLAGVRTELRSSAQVIWNRWLAEFITASPTRLMGVLQNPVWDIDLAVHEIEWGAARGLRVVNLPAPRRDFPAYTDRAYDKLWAACVDNGCVLTTHSGGGEEPLGVGQRRGNFLHISENHWLGNRGLAQLIFGGVFHRYPDLRYILTEQRTEFAPDLVKHLDSAYDAGTRGDRRGGGLYPAAPFLYVDSDIDPDDGSGEALPPAAELLLGAELHPVRQLHGPLRGRLPAPGRARQPALGHRLPAPGRHLAADAAVDQAHLQHRAGRRGAADPGRDGGDRLRLRPRGPVAGRPADRPHPGRGRDPR